MRDKILSLLNNHGFVSGEKIAEQLGLSRTAVWKQIETLRGMGYRIISVKNKGYSLVYRPDIPYPEEILPDLNTKIIGRKLCYFKTLSSTNLFARELAKKGVEDGTVVVADTQSRGRGRRNRAWFSPYGGLWFSIILYPGIPPEKGMMLMMIASIATVEGIKEVTDVDAEIKWPNDVLIKGKKVCGVLIEMDAELDRINYAIVGIGINVNNKLEKSLEERATTLRDEVDTKVSKVQLLKSVLKNFDEKYMELLHGGYGAIRKKWILYSKIVGREIVVKEENKTLKGIVERVDEEGYLILKTKEGGIKILSGDVEYNEEHIDQ